MKKVFVQLGVGHQKNLKKGYGSQAKKIHPRPPTQKQIILYIYIYYIHNSIYIYVTEPHWHSPSACHRNSHASKASLSAASGTGPRRCTTSFSWLNLQEILLGGWKICSSKWESCPTRGWKFKKQWNHHLEIFLKSGTVNHLWQTWLSPLQEALLLPGGSGFMWIP